MGSSYVQFYNIIYHLIYPIQWSYLMYNDHISHTMGWSPLGWYGYMAGVSTKVTASNPWRIRIKELLLKSGQSFNCETFRDTDIPQILRLWSSKSMPRNSSKIPASWSGSRGVWSWCFEPLGQRFRHVTCHRERWPSVRTSPLLWSRSLRSSSLRPAPDVPDVPDVCRSDVPVPVTACDSRQMPTVSDRPHVPGASDASDKFGTSNWGSEQTWSSMLMDALRWANESYVRITPVLTCLDSGESDNIRACEACFTDMLRSCGAFSREEALFGSWFVVSSSPPLWAAAGRWFDELWMPQRSLRFGPLHGFHRSPPRSTQAGSRVVSDGAIWSICS